MMRSSVVALVVAGIAGTAHAQSSSSGPCRRVVTITPTVTVQPSTWSWSSMGAPGNTSRTASQSNSSSSFSGLAPPSDVFSGQRSLSSRAASSGFASVGFASSLSASGSVAPSSSALGQQSASSARVTSPPVLSSSAISSLPYSSLSSYNVTYESIRTADAITSACSSQSASAAIAASSTILSAGASDQCGPSATSGPTLLGVDCRNTAVHDYVVRCDTYYVFDNTIIPRLLRRAELSLEKRILNSIDAAVSLSDCLNLCIANNDPDTVIGVNFRDGPPSACQCGYRITEIYVASGSGWQAALVSPEPGEPATTTYIEVTITLGGDVPSGAPPEVVGRPVPAVDNSASMDLSFPPVSVHPTDSTFLMSTAIGSMVSPSAFPMSDFVDTSRALPTNITSAIESYISDRFGTQTTTVVSTEVITTTSVSVLVSVSEFAINETTTLLSSLSGSLITTEIVQNVTTAISFAVTEQTMIIQPTTVFATAASGTVLVSGGAGGAQTVVVTVAPPIRSPTSSVYEPQCLTAVNFLEQIGAGNPLQGARKRSLWDETLWEVQGINPYEPHHV